MNKKKKNPIIIIVFGLVLIILAIILIIAGIKGYRNIDYKKYKPKMDDKNNLANCIDNCSKVHKSYYYTFGVDDLSSDFKEAMDEYNKETLRLYEEHSKSDLSASECAGKESTYKYRYNYATDFYWGDTIDYISFAYRRVIQDVCTGEEVVTEPQTYIYSREKKRLLTTKEFRKKEGISDDDISLSIKSSMVLLDYYAEEDEKDKKTSEYKTDADTKSYLFDYHKQNYKYTKKDGKLYYKFFFIGDEKYMYYYQSDVDKYYQTVLNEYDD